jgi:hypothetical protein
MIIFKLPKGDATDPAGLCFVADANEEGMKPGRLGFVKDAHRAGARGNDPTVGETNPLASVLINELVAHSPVVRFILPTIGVNLSGDFGRELVDDRIHESPQVFRCLLVILPPFTE